MLERTGIGHVLLISMLVGLALLLHGYHMGIEDEAIYLPAIKKHLDPGLYTHDAALFLAQARFTGFDELIALLVRATRLPVDHVLFFLYLASLFGVLLGCLQLSRRCFEEVSAQWASVALIAVLLTLPVTGTRLYIVDQHLHPRNLATVAILFALVNVLGRRYACAAFCFCIGAVFHVQMTFYAALFAVLLTVDVPSPRRARLGLLVSPAPGIQAGADVWSRIKATRVHHYPLRWEWYEWVGVVAPISLLAWYGSFRENSASFRRLSLRMAIFGVLITLLALVLTIPAQLQKFAHLQPMRGLHLLYLVFFLLTGGLIGSRILKDKPLRWAVFFLPLCLCMFTAQRFEFPSSSHIEWPRAVPENPWLQAFEWIRQNTPRDAFFALDPHYMRSPGEDYHGFRALAERSRMADYVKDVGAVSLSLTARTMGADRTPESGGVSETWWDQVRALQGWKDFRIEDFQRLKRDFAVSWVVLERAEIDRTGTMAGDPAGLICPYENSLVMVCRID